MWSLQGLLWLSSLAGHTPPLLPHCCEQVTKDSPYSRQGGLGSTRERGFPDGSAGKESSSNAGDPGLIPRLGRSAGEGIRKGSCKAPGSLELKLPSRSFPPVYAKQRTLSPKEKMDIRLIMPSSQPVQPLADLQNSSPSRLRDSYLSLNNLGEEQTPLGQ